MLDAPAVQAAIDFMQNLLKKVEKSVKNVFDNIQLTDELCARVDEETYSFIHDYKLGN